MLKFTSMITLLLMLVAYMKAAKEEALVSDEVRRIVESKVRGGFASLSGLNDALMR